MLQQGDCTAGEPCCISIRQGGEGFSQWSGLCCRILGRDQRSGHRLSIDAVKGWGSVATECLCDLCAGGKKNEVGLRISLGEAKLTQKKVLVIVQLPCGLGDVILEMLLSVGLILV